MSDRARRQFTDKCRVAGLPADSGRELAASGDGRRSGVRSTRGDLGFTVGEAEIHTMGPDGTSRTSYSKYLTIWRRADAGQWRYVIDGGNDRPQP
ncbi:MAG TPA: hypothetical protein VN953_10445 [Gemmatimonadales bacterium]|nr:hypothetical protein [Gemmatimonadales bacterium]